MDKKLNEELLATWLRMSVLICNRRLTNEMSFNEALIYHLIRKSTLTDKGSITATELCKETKMLKSLMNGTLTSMEKKGLIMRERSSKDKRQIIISINPENADIYDKEHSQILSLIDGMISSVGKERVPDLIDMLNSINTFMENNI